MIDISEALVTAGQLPEWDLRSALSVAESFLTSARWIDHDDGAGESWVFVVDAHQLFASIHWRKQIVFALPAEVGNVQAFDCVVVEVPDFKAVNITASEESITTAFGLLSAHDVAFCALDLFIGTM